MKRAAQQRKLLRPTSFSPSANVELHHGEILPIVGGTDLVLLDRRTSLSLSPGEADLRSDE